MSEISPEATATVAELAQKSRVAARELALLSRARKDEVLRGLADALDSATARVVAANEEDLERGRAGGMPESLQDRLRLTPERVAAVADALRDIAALPDPVGEIVRGSTLANGLQIRQVRVPMGVVGMIYEARPNVTVDAAGLGLKSGNAVILRGGSAAASSNRVLVDVMRESLSAQGINPDAIGLLDGGGHDAVRALMTARGLVDLLIPRGGADLIQSVVLNSTVPVIETGIGNCHVYVDAAADADKAVDIVVNAKTQRPSVCNAAETLLVHRALSDTLLPRIGAALVERGVTLHADGEATQALAAAGVPSSPVTDEDWAAEYYSLDIAVGVVPDVAAATQHIRQWSSGHTEAIVSDSATAITDFLTGVDSAAVAVNASTRFTDGGELGFGAEIGISTQKLHARGPMGLPELTTTTFIITGDGHVRS